MHQFEIEYDPERYPEARDAYAWVLNELGPKDREHNTEVHFRWPGSLNFLLTKSEFIKL